ncbi:MAG: TldD/PmbA family protein [Rhodospirillaceae bacterium]
MQQPFFELADLIQSSLRGEEGFLARFSGEASQFVRFNRSAVRQAGAVEQRYLSLELFRGKRHACQVITLTGADDREAVRGAVAQLRDVLADTADDPHFLINEVPQSTTRVLPSALPGEDEAVAAVVDAGKGHDLVGIYAAGPIHRGFANSYGQRNWDTVHAFSADLSFYLQSDKAVKVDHAGISWNRAAFDAKMMGAKSRLVALARSPKTITPGAYRVFFAPAAMEEIFSLMSWGGFSLAAEKTATTPLIRMVAEGARLDPRVTLTENIAEGLAPAFQSEGFVKPARVPLIEAGRYAGALASPRAAAEFNVVPNGADPGESPVALDMAAGELADADILKTLGTGIYVGNLWYLNYSDRNACRLTGMTRFATFWVENGEIAAPLNVMRFDDTIYNMLGANLIALTAERDLRVSTSTYDSRSTGSMRLPGAVIADLAMTL